jgi:hypothetical protein
VLLWPTAIGTPRFGVMWPLAQLTSEVVTCHVSMLAGLLRPSGIPEIPSPSSLDGFAQRICV